MDILRDSFVLAPSVLRAPVASVTGLSPLLSVSSKKHGLGLHFSFYSHHQTLYPAQNKCGKDERKEEGQLIPFKYFPGVGVPTVFSLVNQE